LNPTEKHQDYKTMAEKSKHINTRRLISVTGVSVIEIAPGNCILPLNFTGKEGRASLLLRAVLLTEFLGRALKSA
jgi:hypothetical protein